MPPHGNLSETWQPTTLPTTNAHGLPVVPMTDEQKYTFDLKGWILLPSLLTEDQSGAIREHCIKCLDEPESGPTHERHFLAGPTQALLDHPAIVGGLNEIIAHNRVASEDCYGFRFDHGFVMRRTVDEQHNPFNPHGGGGLHALVGNSHIYQHQWGKVHTGLTRVVCELSGV